MTICRFLKKFEFESFSTKTYRFNKLLKLVNISQVDYHVIFYFDCRIDFDNLIIMVPNFIWHRFKSSFQDTKPISSGTV